ncbi:MAG: helix-turn-helix domain-containing protein [Lachnospiraceae bacterium]
MYRHIRDLREDHDLKQREVAVYLGCSQRSYSDYENGKTRVPPDILIELSRLYGTSVDYLLDLTDVKTPYPRSREK